MWFEFVRFYLTLACNRYGNDDSTRPTTNEKLTLFIDDAQLANIPYEDRPARGAAAPSDVEGARKGVKVSKAQIECFWFKFEVRPCDLSKGPGTS